MSLSADELVQSVNEFPLDELFIEPLFAMFNAQSRPTYDMASILKSAEKILPTAAFPPEFSPELIVLIRNIFSMRFFAYRRFNGITEHRLLTNACMKADLDDELAMLILASPMVKGPADEHGIQFDHVEFAANLRNLVQLARTMVDDNE